MFEALSYHDRLAACRLVAGRWAGRAELTRRAETNAIDLVALETRLGLPSAGIEGVRCEIARLTRAAIAASGACSSPSGRNAPLPRPYAAARETIRALRAAAKPPAPPEPGRIAKILVKRRLLAAYADRFRRAAHSHTTIVELVPEGCESAESRSDRLRPEAVGLPAAYARKGYSVAASAHVFRCSLEHRPHWRDGALYLSPRVRVRQGRGTALAVERLADGPRGPVWR